jgi:hypothetical protein
MIGSTSLLVCFLLTANPGDAGMATISDRGPAIESAVPSNGGQAALVGYHQAGSDIEAEEYEDDGPSLVQTMLLEQEGKAPPIRRNPFLEEPLPGEIKPKSPNRLPAVPNPLPESQQPPAELAPYHTEPNAISPDETAEAPGECTIDSCDAGESRPSFFGRNRSALRKVCGDICYEGWLDQGVTVNPYSPRDRSNYPVGFNNRSNEYQLNQAYLRLRRDASAQGDRWGVGGTVDFLYGTDSMFASSRGLEVGRDFGPKWNAQQYGLAMPQCYMEVFAPWGDGLTVKMGHFYTILGYETTPAPENFFYSHSLSLIYGEPVTETGLLAEKKVGNFKIMGGFTRGWDNWEDNNNDLSFLGGIHWTNDDQRSTLAFMMQSGPEQDEPPQNVNFRNIFSLVYTQKFAERYQYVAQFDFGFEERGDIAGLPSARWSGLDQYLFYTINEKWKAGVRFEWFRDLDGVRVPHVSQGADYYELTAGLNWTPTSRVVVRPELRYDWVGTPDCTPYCDAGKSYQLLLGCDVIVKF